MKQDPGQVIELILDLSHIFVSNVFSSVANHFIALIWLKKCPDRNGNCVSSQIVFQLSKDLWNLKGWTQKQLKLRLLFFGGARERLLVSQSSVGEIE